MTKDIIIYKNKEYSLVSQLLKDYPEFDGDEKIIIKTTTNNLMKQIRDASKDNAFEIINQMQEEFWERMEETNN